MVSSNDTDDVDVVDDDENVSTRGVQTSRSFGDDDNTDDDDDDDVVHAVVTTDGRNCFSCWEK
jgi:hypothetical protein